MIVHIAMPDIPITTDASVVKALVCSTSMHERTVKRWIREPHRCHAGTAHLLAAKAEALGLTKRIEQMREGLR